MPCRLSASNSCHDLFRGLGVERAGRLVRQQQLRIVDERARDGDALLLAARQLLRAVIEPVAEAHLLEPRPRHRLRRARPRLGVEQGQHHLAQRRRARQQIELLEHEADRAVSERGQLIARTARAMSRPAMRSSPAVGTIERADQVHHGRLAGARRAHDGHVFALRGCRTTHPRAPAPTARRACRSCARRVRRSAAARRACAGRDRQASRDRLICAPRPRARSTTLSPSFSTSPSASAKWLSTRPRSIWRLSSAPDALSTQTVTSCRLLRPAAASRRAFHASKADRCASRDDAGNGLRQPLHDARIPVSPSSAGRVAPDATADPPPAFVPRLGGRPLHDGGDLRRLLAPSSASSRLTRSSSRSSRCCAWLRADVGAAGAARLEPQRVVRQAQRAVHAWRFRSWPRRSCRAAACGRRWPPR